MDEFSVKPEDHQVQQAKSQVEKIVSKYSHSVDVENAEFYLGWQDIDRKVSVMSPSGNSISVVLNPDEEDWGELEEGILRALLEIEFEGKTDTVEFSFNWQEVVKWAYVTTKLNKITDEEPVEDEEIGENWTELREALSEDIESYNELFYLKSIRLGEMIGQKLLEKYELEDFLELKRSDILEAGDELFGEEE